MTVLNLEFRHFTQIFVSTRMRLQDPVLGQTGLLANRTDWVENTAQEGFRQLHHMFSHMIEDSVRSHVIIVTLCRILVWQ